MRAGLRFGIWSLGFVWCVAVGADSSSLAAQTLDLPARPANAPGGLEFIGRITALDLRSREQELFAQIISGNVPGFLRNLCPVQVTNVFNGRTNAATFYVTPDYLAVGSDEDYFLAPLSPNMAQKIAGALRCSLPTRKIVDLVYEHAEVRLEPSPIPPSAAMTTVLVFSNHNSTVRTQRREQLKSHPLGALVAGHKKDVVISPKLASAPGKVAIYGWHRTNGTPIQPLYLGHTADWVDYSHGIRLVQQRMLVNEASQTVAAVLADPSLCGLLSDEGVLSTPCYSSPANLARPVGLQPGGRFNERTVTFKLEPGIAIHINAPAEESFAGGKKVMVIFYALPNGNTTEQTIGKVVRPGDDWHFDIQHLGAQTRFLRELIPERAIVVVYLENDLKSWPAWRKQHGDKTIPEIIRASTAFFPANELELVLSGHSGGGSFIFGYLNAMETIPDAVVRLAFLDSNYAYEQSFTEKLVRWLKTGQRHSLCVLAYDDSVALLNGKTFVSAAGGTWGKSHAMQADLAEAFAFAGRTNADFEKFAALDGRVQFILKKNPENKIFHTVQVERNGFIHSIVSGTPNENRGYDYFGDRAYSKWIESN
jgi:hypothetical protein